MGYYAEITDVMRPSAHVIMVHYDIRVTGTDETVQSGTVGFTISSYNDEGERVDETLEQKRARLSAQFDAYAEQLIKNIEDIDEHFELLRDEAIGYRYLYNKE